MAYFVNQHFDMIKPVEKWYCVRTRAHKEGRVESILRTRLALEIYYPKWRCKRPVAGTLRWVMRPLFPTYLFARFDLQRDQRNVTYAPDVFQIVAFGLEPVEVAEDLIEELRVCSEAHDRDDLFEARQVLKRGDEVVIEAGPFKKLRGIFEKELSDGQRVAILLEILQHQTRVTLPRDYVRPVLAEHPLRR
jgi:transcriptional antiterminator RfaH